LDVNVPPLGVTRMEGGVVHGKLAGLTVPAPLLAFALVSPPLKACVPVVPPETVPSAPPVVIICGHTPCAAAARVSTAMRHVQKIAMGRAART
jgi:hypothetical protein